MDICMGINESHCCIPVTNTSLLINYILQYKIKMKKKKEKKWSDWGKNNLQGESIVCFLEIH